ncbi:MAG: hypothetical protein P8X57_12575 [Cyclobacteriaceae bacterium]
MDLTHLDSDLTALIRAKLELSQLDYADEKYDDKEEEIHDLEDDFMEKYGDYLDDALHEVHDEMCPDSDVLLPIAYIPNRLVRTEDGYRVPASEGVFVDVDDYATPNTKLVILPEPARIVLLVGGEVKEVLWSLSKKESE